MDPKYLLGLELGLARGLGISPVDLAKMPYNKVVQLDKDLADWLKRIRR